MVTSFHGQEKTGHGQAFPLGGEREAADVGAPAAGASENQLGREALYKKLDKAVEDEDYAAAAELKKQIDRTL